LASSTPAISFVASLASETTASRFQCQLGRTEIQYFRVPSLDYEDVRWFDIAVDDASPVSRVERVHNFDGESSSRRTIGAIKKKPGAQRPPMCTTDGGKQS
jgi:hypothetical protein